MTDILAADATSQLRALADRTLSARELLELELARDEAVHDRLNAVVVRDLERARTAADALDQARARGDELGPLAGLPMTVKETYDLTGLPATAGVSSFRERDCEDAVVIARARAAGAVIWGKTNIPVMAGDWQSYNSLYGVTNNPWDLTRTPGGSSGGSAAALASQVTSLEMGSDIAGSLRVPAAFCGVFAHKPTFELLPRTGHVPPRPGTFAPADLSVVGPMARSSRDLALLLHVMSDGATPRDIAPAPRALRVGLWLEDAAFLLDPQVRTAIEAWAARAEAAGIAIRPITSPVSGEALLESYNVLLMSQIAAGFPDKTREQLAARRADALAKINAGAGPLSKAATILASTATHRDWMIANETRWRLKAQVAEAFSEVDVIVAPVAPVEPFAHDHSPFNDRELTCSTGKTIPYNAMMMWVALATVCGLPATAVPAGLSAAGLPVGVQIIGPDGGDLRTLAAARALEEATGGYVPPPLAAT